MSLVFFLVAGTTFWWDYLVHHLTVGTCENNAYVFVAREFLGAPHINSRYLHRLEMSIKKGPNEIFWIQGMLESQVFPEPQKIGSYRRTLVVCLIKHTSFYIPFSEHPLLVVSGTGAYYLNLWIDAALLWCSYIW